MWLSANVQYIVYRRDIVIQNESTGRAAAVGNIDYRSREACSVEEQKEAPQENAFFRTVLWPAWQAEMWREALTNYWKTSKLSRINAKLIPELCIM